MMKENNKQIKIIGCGVSGLTVGIMLLEEGYNVEIITDKLPAETTSAKAAAIWFPYEVNPKEKAKEWSKISYNKFKEFCDDKTTGVSMVSLTTLIKKEEDAWWKDAIPENEIRKARLDELPKKYPLGYKINVPLAETPIYLEYLLNQFKKLKGLISIKKITSINQLQSENNIIINCTGLGSRELVSDTKLYPILGQIVKAYKQENINCIATDFTFGKNNDKLAYVIPRKDCLILGGTAIKDKEELTPDDELTKSILIRCSEIEPNLSEIKIKSVLVGLRPGRPEIRLEREGKNTIHNYGHGGGGYTVSWGCATAVLELVNQINKE